MLHGVFRSSFGSADEHSAGLPAGFGDAATSPRRKRFPIADHVKLPTLHFCSQTSKSALKCYVYCETIVTLTKCYLRPLFHTAAVVVLSHGHVKIFFR